MDPVCLLAKATRAMVAVSLVLVLLGPTVSLADGDHAPTEQNVDTVQTCKPDNNAARIALTVEPGKKDISFKCGDNNDGTLSPNPEEKKFFAGSTGTDPKPLSEVCENAEVTKTEGATNKMYTLSLPSKVSKEHKLFFTCTPAAKNNEKEGPSGDKCMVEITVKAGAGDDNGSSAAGWLAVPSLLIGQVVLSLLYA
ncbi:SAG-related sequence [Besnoitia besnoiti]|uniref:SAG-related sequence n=1 Tax=Besnoitia besnoiti TaxID=94643 RepID=A0A2A9MG36_BESBE|nr:SAG-related sequence [Besnoitia besnoiti]PFH36955.1 SAG-related sequence [Besnoitia besnoiti]